MTLIHSFLRTLKLINNLFAFLSFYFYLCFMNKEHIKYFFPIKIYSREYYNSEKLYMKIFHVYFLGIPIYRKNIQKIKI